MTTQQLTGIVLIGLPIAFNLVFLALGKAFEYPAILRQPTAAILQKFHDGGRRLVTMWYAFGMTALLAIPAALLAMAVFYTQNPALAVASGLLGTTSGLVQALGLFRWVFLVPILAATDQAADATPATHDAVRVVFEAFHQYIGVAVGEHLGYLLTAAWTLALCALILGAAAFSPLIAAFGLVAAIGILVGLLEPAGWKPAGAINAIAYIVWSLWLIIVGLTLLFG